MRSATGCISIGVASSARCSPPRFADPADNDCGRSPLTVPLGARERREMKYPILLPAALILSGCGGENTASRVQPPGTETSTESRALEAGAALLQDKAPLRTLDAYLDGFHFANGKLDAQMEAHHYCGHLNEEVI